MTFTIEDHLPAEYAARSLRADVLAGLTRAPKALPPTWFYDKVGSELFEEITTVPEYYPTRAEREILAARAGRIATGHGFDTLVELGSGSSQKTRLLLDALRAGGQPLSYLALDVSETALVEAARGLVADYPGLQARALVADFTHQLDLLARPADPGGVRLVAFLGGTIGNFEPSERAEFRGSR